MNGTARGPRGGPVRGLVGGAAGLAVLVQLVVLYLPTAPGAASLPGADKVVHLLVFAVPVLLLLLVRAPVPMVLGAFAAHAVVSEAVQSAWLPERSGDVTDVVADLAGVALGWAAWRLLRHRAPSSRW